ncbi:MAG: hypothetical protein JRH01_01210 [Deltaproteobacteria bacterium]|nr:hypothetical protein [Deltaproteobacteria bacterium]
MKRRHLVEGETDAEKSLALAEAYLEEGRQQEAVVFLSKAGATEKLDALLEEAVEAGDAFLVRQVAEALDRVLPSATWARVEAQAKKLGKDRYASEASRQAGRGED